MRLKCITDNVDHAILVEDVLPFKAGGCVEVEELRIISSIPDREPFWQFLLILLTACFTLGTNHLRVIRSEIGSGDNGRDIIYGIEEYMEMSVVIPGQPFLTQLSHISQRVIDIQACDGRWFCIRPF